MNILKIEPMEHPRLISVNELTLEWLQNQVGGQIEAVYPFDDPVAIICDEEGKLKAKNLNRVLRDKDDEIYDILCGDFLIVGLGEEDFTGLSDKMLVKYSSKFYYPEYITFDSDNKTHVTLIDDGDIEGGYM